MPRTSFDLLFNAFHGGLPALCVATDLSEGGLGLRRLQDIRTVSDEAIEVEFQLPGEDRVISARGRLRDGPKPAVVFDLVADADRALIREFVAAA